MSDLGAIFHVKKDGVQYDAHAYTTLDECPYPNLKIVFKGTTAYVKMAQGKGNGDVPCYAKDKAGVIYQVRKEAIPTGSVHMNEGSTITVTVPAAIKVLQFVTDYGANSFTLGVTPGSTHAFSCKSQHHRSWRTTVTCNTHSTWTKSFFAAKTGFTIKWSPEINKMSLDSTDY